MQYFTLKVAVPSSNWLRFSRETTEKTEGNLTGAEVLEDSLGLRLKEITGSGYVKIIDEIHT